MSDGFLGGVETTPEKTPEPVEAAAESTISPDEAPLEAERAAFEQSAEQKDAFLEKVAEEAPTTQVVNNAAAPAAEAVEQVVAAEDPVVMEVEKILEDGLGDFVETMPEDARQRFLVKGKEVSIQIADMVRKFKVELRRTISLIRDWLMTIPGANRYFLEQEAKIKTDRIISLARQRKEDAGQNV